MQVVIDVPNWLYKRVKNALAIVEVDKESEDWCDVPSDEMTLEQARQAVKDLRKKLAESERDRKVNYE